MSSSDRNFHLVTVNLFLWRQIYSCECDGKFISITGIVFVWQEIPSCNIKFALVAQNSFTLIGKIFLPAYFFLWLLFSSCYHFAWTQLNFSRQNVVILAKFLCEAPRFCCIQDPISLWESYPGQDTQMVMSREDTKDV